MKDRIFPIKCLFTSEPRFPEKVPTSDSQLFCHRKSCQQIGPTNCPNRHGWSHFDHRRNTCQRRKYFDWFGQAWQVPRYQPWSSFLSIFENSIKIYSCQINCQSFDWCKLKYDLIHRSTDDAWISFGIRRTIYDVRISFKRRFPFRISFYRRFPFRTSF